MPLTFRDWLCLTASVPTILKGGRWAQFGPLQCYNLPDADVGIIQDLTIAGPAADRWLLLT